MARPSFRTKFEPHYGEAITVANNVQRLTAPNQSAFTFYGTNTYIIGDKNVALIDPGPLPKTDDAFNHLECILKTLKGRTLTHIIITHTHMDHSPLSRELTKITGAKTYGEGPHRNARELHIGEINALDAAGDKDFIPDVFVKHGDIIEADGFRLEAIYTPGHATNHMAYALLDTEYLFSGDHVMAWATSIVAPPDGAMKDYMNSLEILSKRDESIYFPGHGGRVEKAKEYVRALRAHRKMRETAILHRIRKGDQTIAEIVAVIYKETDKRLHGAAGLSVFAHIEDLLEKNLISCEGTPSLSAKYTPIIL